MRTFLTAEWRWLAMINYPIDPALLEPLVPRGVELDFFEGRTYVSLVGFLFLDTRVWGFPMPFHRDFEEVNLRFYVRHKTGDEVRRGVVFVKEIVPKAAIAWTARAFYNERYVAMPMRHELSEERVGFDWKLGSDWNSISVGRKGDPEFAAEGSEERFITEHYWGYTAQRDGCTVEYRVEHPSWRLWQAKEPRIEIDVERLYGREFVEVLGSSPTSAFLAEGSRVAVRRPRRLTLD